jgi:hypothetical protein
MPTSMSASSDGIPNRMRITAPAVPLSVGAGQKIRPGRHDPVPRAQEPMAKLMRQQNPQQGGRKGQSANELPGVIENPDKWHKIRNGRECRESAAKVRHVERASAGRGKHRQDAQDDGQRRLPAGYRSGFESAQDVSQSQQSQRTDLRGFCGIGADRRIRQMEFLARLEADRLARSDRHLGAGARVPSDACLARTHIEDPKTAKLDPVAGRKRFLQALEDRCRSRAIAGFGNRRCEHGMIRAVQRKAGEGGRDLVRVVVVWLRPSGVG